MTTPITVLWHASRFDSTDEAAYLRRTLHWLRRRRRRPAVIGLGEIQTRHAIESVTALLTKRGYRTARADEYLVAWLPRHVTPRGDDFISLRRMGRVFAGRDSWRNPDMLTARFRAAATGAPITVDLLHANSAVELGDSYRPGPNAQSHRQVYARYRRIRQRRGPAVTSILMDDSNADQRRPSWRTRLREATGLRSMWERVKAVGTHRNWGSATGHRAIDRISSTAPFTAAGACPWPRVDEHLDHRAVYAIIAVPVPTTHSSKG